jgi:hypothetical protein
MIDAKPSRRRRVTCPVCRRRVSLTAKTGVIGPHLDPSGRSASAWRCDGVGRKPGEPDQAADLRWLADLVARYPWHARGLVAQLPDDDSAPGGSFLAPSPVAYVRDRVHHAAYRVSATRCRITEEEQSWFGDDAPVALEAMSLVCGCPRMWPGGVERAARGVVGAVTRRADEIPDDASDAVVALMGDLVLLRACVRALDEAREREARRRGHG